MDEIGVCLGCRVREAVGRGDISSTEGMSDKSMWGIDPKSRLRGSLALPGPARHDADGDIRFAEMMTTGRV